jgi:hypothetical protein
MAMSMPSDFLVADRSEVGAITSSEDRKRWPLLESSGFTVLEVGLLHFAITGEDSALLGSYVDTFPCLDDSEDHWLHEIPASLVDELVRAGDLQAVAARWAAFEELEGATADSLASVLVELQGLARLAAQERRSLLLWTSL